MNCCHIAGNQPPTDLKPDPASTRDHRALTHQRLHKRVFPATTGAEHSIDCGPSDPFGFDEFSSACHFILRKHSPFVATIAELDSRAYRMDDAYTGE